MNNKLKELGYSSEQIDTIKSNGIEYIKVLLKRQKDKEEFLKLIEDVIFIYNVPEEGIYEPQCITDVRGAESGENALIIETKGNNTKWRHTIISEEIG